MNCSQCGQPLEPESRFCMRCGRATGEHPASRPDKTQASQLPEEVFEGKWKLLRQLGEGGMGTVYLAQELQLDREVAVKILGKALAEDPDLVQRFEREARLTAKLEHPNVVPVYAVGRHEGRPFIVMKKLDGQTLSDFVRDKRALDLHETLNVVRQLAAGLDFIHEKGFVHRDIKASNIFLSPTGHATILDFGILRSKSQEALTRTGMVMGTPQYMSPEQALGLRDVDHRADLYALAVVVYECLSGTLPFDGENELSIIQMQAHMPAPDIRERAPWVPAPVAEVLIKALAKRPEDRYPSAGELYRALDAARARVLFSGPLPVAPPRQAPKPAGPPVPSGAGLAAIQAELAAQGSPAPRGPSTASLALRLRARRVPLAVLAGGVGLLALGGYYAATRNTAAAIRKDLPNGHETPRDIASALGVDAGVSPSDVAATPPDAGSTQVAEIEEPSDEPVPEKPVPPESGSRSKHSKTGEVRVITTVRGEPYWASVRIDGTGQSRNTPLSLELSPGRHALRIQRVGFRSMDRQIRVVAGRSQTIRLELQP